MIFICSINIYFFVISTDLNGKVENIIKDLGSIRGGYNKFKIKNRKL